LAFLSDDTLYGINADGTGLVDITPSLGALCFAWAPDSSKIAFVGWGSCYRLPCYDIYQVNPDGSGLIRLTYTNSFKGNLSWSPDGTQCVFSSEKPSGSGTGIYVVNTDGTDPEFLTDGADPLYSPDGTKIAFHKGSSTTSFSLYSMNPDGTGQVQIFPLDVRGETWSPDSQKLAFEYYEEVYTINADGTNLINLSKLSSHDESPTWSHDSSQIAFQSDRNALDQAMRLYIINADGTGLTPLTTDDSTSRRDSIPKWGP